MSGQGSGKEWVTVAVSAMGSGSDWEVVLVRGRVFARALHRGPLGVAVVVELLRARPPS